MPEPEEGVVERAEEKLAQTEEEKRQAVREFEQVQEEKRGRGRPKKTLTEEDLKELGKLIAGMKKGTSFAELEKILGAKKEKRKPPRAKAYSEPEGGAVSEIPAVRESESEDDEEEKKAEELVGEQIEAHGAEEPE